MHFHDKDDNPEVGFIYFLIACQVIMIIPKRVYLSVEFITKC